MALFPSEGPEDSPSPLRVPFIDKIRTNAAFVLCVAMSLFHLYTAGIGLLQTPVQRAVHVGFVLVLVFLLYPLRRGWHWADVLLVLCSIAGTGYIALFSDAIALRGGKVLPYELVLGTLTLAAVLEAGRRLNLPVLYATVLEELCGEVERLLGVDSIPIWPMVRYMQRPWEGESMWSAPVREKGA